MSLLEEVLKAREEAEGKPQCQKCKHLFGIDKGTPFCKFIKCELVEGRRLNNVREYKFKALFENQRTGIRTWFYVGVGDKVMPEWGARVTEWLQYTGLPDKNGNELWESDIIENEHKERYLIVWDGTGFKVALNGSKKAIYSVNEYWFKSCKKIGNKWDNPELLKEVE